MALKKFLESRRKKEIERINRELEALKKKGLNFEKKGEIGAEPFKNKRHDSSPVSNRKLWFISSIIIVFIVLTWFFTQIYYNNKLDKIEDELVGLQGNLSLKENELVNKTEEIEKLEEDIDELSSSEDELISDYFDMEEEIEELKKSIKELEDKKLELLVNITNLKGDLIEEKALVDFYMDCITDELDENLNQCGDAP